VGKPLHFRALFCSNVGNVHQIKAILRIAGGYYFRQRQRYVI
jgi:hypothetical protein